MMKAIRFAKIKVEVEVVEVMVEEIYDEYYGVVYDIKAIKDSMKHWFLEEITTVTKHQDNDSYYKWVERNMSPEDFAIWCEIEQSYIDADNEKRNKLKMQAIQNGYLTIEECAKL